MNEQEDQLARDIRARWAGAIGYRWDDAVHQCRGCAYSFETGDVFFQFGDPEAAIALAEYRCALCMMQSLAAGEPAGRPTGVGVFVQEPHRVLKFDEMPPDLQVKIVEGFDKVDRLVDGLMRAIGFPALAQPIPEA
jgi:hypothetical protein